MSCRGVEIAHIVRDKLSLTLRTALPSQLALKHRQNKSQQQRIVVFVGSPVEASDEELLATGKKLKKNNVALDIISFGEEVTNETKLRKLVESVNSGDNRLVDFCPPAPHNQLTPSAYMTPPVIW